MSAAGKIWRTGWRFGLCALLLVWIFHSIFVNEARQRQGAANFAQLPRAEQWRQGWQIGPGELARTLGNVRPGAFALSVVLMGVTVALGVARWRLALRVQGLELSWGRANEISLVAHFFNSFLLGATGGDLMKAYYAARETHHKKTEAALTVFVDRVIGLWAMLLFASVMMLFNFPLLFAHGGLRPLAGLIVALMIGCTGFLFLAFRGGVSRGWTGAREWLRRLPKGEWLERALDSCRQFGRDPAFLWRALVVSMTLNAFCVFQFVVLARGMNLAIAPVTLAVIVPIVICVAALPITPSGLGVRENLFVHLLAAKAVSVDATSALSLSLLAYAGSLFWSLVGGGVYMLFKQKHHLTETELAEERES